MVQRWRKAKKGSQLGLGVLFSRCFKLNTHWKENESLYPETQPKSQWHDPPPTCFKHHGNVASLKSSVILRIFSAEISTAFPVGSRQLGGVLQLAGDRTTGFTHISEFEGLPEGEATLARAGTPPAHTPESQMDEKTNTDHGQNPARDLYNHLP